MIFGAAKKLESLKETWARQWEDSLAAWSRFTKLAEPRWCYTAKEEKEENLSGSFAMIRLQDHAVVLSLRQIHEKGLEEHGREIMAHEIGHHVYVPGDLSDNARLLARIKAGLPTREQYAGFVSNLYADLLINDRLYRSAKLDMSGVYKKLKLKKADRIWNLFMRIYEGLWNLPPGELTTGKLDKQIQIDATLGAKVIRVYAKDWMAGAGRFAALLLPYLQEIANTEMAIPWLDTQQAGSGDEIPDGLTGIDEEELDGAIHPAMDENITGMKPKGSGGDKPGKGMGREKIGGEKNQYRSPGEYSELMKDLGVTLPLNELIIRYYRERAMPHLIPFPVHIIPETADPLPEGLEEWDIGSPLSSVDWLESVIKSPIVIPGVTTVERSFGTTEGTNPQKQPVDLYFGVDCSGSMANPKFNLSYPVLAGAIIVLSALRSGARVMATLSGEPGEHSDTGDFIRNEKEIMNVLTGYLGTGYAFGIMRLKESFIDGEKPKRPIHILIVTDGDIFSMLESRKDGWEIAAKSLEVAKGGGTFVLNIPNPGWCADQVERLRNMGWKVYFVSDWQEMVAFARAFAKEKYKDENVTNHFVINRTGS